MNVYKKNSLIMLSTLCLFACGEEDKSDTASVDENEETDVESGTESEESENSTDENSEGENSDETIESLLDVSEYESGVYTFAGSGTYDSVDGSREQAAFADPAYLRLGPDGYIYIIDRQTSILRKMSMDGTVQSVNFQGGYPKDPVGFDIADNGDIYMSSSEEHCIYKISEGVSSVFACTCSVTPNDGAAGYIDGAVAKFQFPKEVVLDSEGNLIVADASNLLLRKISPDGITSTLAGLGPDEFGVIHDGPALSSIVYYPISVTVDDNDNVYFSGLDNCVRRVIDGNIERLAGLCQNYSNSGTTDGAAFDAKFDLPRGLYFNQSNELMITDANTSRIRILSEDFSTVSTLAGVNPGYYDGSLEEAKFDYPTSILDVGGAYLVTDSVNGRIRLIVP